MINHYFKFRKRKQKKRIRKNLIRQTFFAPTLLSCSKLLFYVMKYEKKNLIVAFEYTYIYVVNNIYKTGHRKFKSHEQIVTRASTCPRTIKENKIEKTKRPYTTQKLLKVHKNQSYVSRVDHNGKCIIVRDINKERGTQLKSPSKIMTSHRFSRWYQLLFFIPK